MVRWQTGKLRISCIGFSYNNNELNAFKSGDHINTNLEYVIQSKLNDDLQPIISNITPMTLLILCPTNMCRRKFITVIIDFNRSVPDINYLNLFNENV